MRREILRERRYRLPGRLLAYNRNRSLTLCREDQLLFTILEW